MSTFSVFIDLADELEALMLVEPQLAGGKVTRDRQSPVLAQNQELVNLKLDKAVSARGGVTGSPDDWATDFIFECYRTARADELPTKVVDPLLRAVFERLGGASALPQFEALAVQDVLPDPQIEWDLGQGEKPQICATLSVRIIHRTKPGQLVPWDA